MKTNCSCNNGESESKKTIEKRNMVVYHGTPQIRANIIENSRRIERTSKENAIFGDEIGTLKTKLGYVYVTDDASAAFFHGLLAAMQKGPYWPQSIAIYKSEVANSDLEPDEAEIDNPTMMSSKLDFAPQKYKIARDLYLGVDVKAVAHIETLNFQAGCDLCERSDFEQLIFKYWKDV